MTHQKRSPAVSFNVKTRALSAWVLAAMAVLAMHAAPARSANGMNAPGNGTTQLGMAGAGTAMAQDASATVRNPAAGAWLGNGMTGDLGIAVPDGGYVAGELGLGASFGLIDFKPGRNTSVQGVFPVPGFARNWRLDDRNAVGIGVVASGLSTLSRGGAATLARGIPIFEARCNGDFGGGSALSPTTDLAGLCGSSGSPAGVSLKQILVSAHWAYRVTPDLSLGIAPVGAFQVIKLRGLGAFAAFSNFPDQTTENDAENAYGGGIRVGALWEALPWLGVGLAYQSRIYTTEFDRFRGTILTGSLDFAPTLNAGLQIHLAPEHRVLLDVEQIRYGDIKPLGNLLEPQRFTDECFVPRLLARSLPNPPSLDACLGGATGPGFGWHDITVYKFGYQGRTGRLTYRAGYSFGGNPEGRDQILPAVFAPAITDKHATLGLSWKLSSGLSADWALVYAVKNRMRVRNALSSVTPDLSGSTLVGFTVDQDPDDQEVEAYISVWQSQFGLTWTFD